MQALGMPALCRRCGAPCDVAPELSLRCRFCGQLDRLPGDELGRALELKRRLAEAARSVDQLEGVERSLAHVFEEPRALLRASFSFVAAAGLVVLTTVSQLASSSLSAGASLVLALPALFVAAFLVAVIVAPLLWGRARYRRLVRPLLGARPPFAPGLPARCRACGGDLPAPGGRDVFVACRFCATSNLLTADLAARAGRLDEEIALFQARAQGLQAHASGIGASMTRTFRIVLAIGVVGLAVASCLSSWLVTYFL